MENLLQQIRGVVGVAGVIVLDRHTGKSDSLFPASFDDETKLGLHQRFLELTRAISVETQCRFKLAQGWCVVRSTPDHAFLVLAKEDLNIATLNLVLKSITVALAQDLGLQASKRQFVFDAQSAGALVSAVNLICDHFTDKVNRLQLTQMLRDSRSRLADQFPQLKQFTVDPSGRVSLIKGSEQKLDERTVEAVAFWMVTFKDLVKRQALIAGFNLKAVTREVQPDLEWMGFYRSFQKVSAQ